MQSSEIRSRFLKFFEKRGHAIIPSSPLVPENDPSVLFNTAGMQPLVPYLLGKPHPKGARLANSQKCVRTVDIDEIGDNTHATFFEMLGNWSLGDYFKEDAIQWSFEFLTSKEEGLGLDPNRLYVTVFEGDENAPRDLEAAEIWKRYIPEHRIYFRGAKSNWWSPGENGPCGPDTEMFYDVTKDGLGDMTLEEYLAADDRQEVVEIWNDVFMEYEKKDGKVVGKLATKNVDTGSGLERVVMMVQGKNNIFDTDLFAGILGAIKERASTYDERAARIVADHIRTATFLIGDGVLPSNTDQGYVLRRLIRRAVRYISGLGITDLTPAPFVAAVVATYRDAYPNLVTDEARIVSVIAEEGDKFRKTLERGMKEFQKITESIISAEQAFDLYQTYGFPIEITKEVAGEQGKRVDEDGFRQKLADHQALSRAGAEQKFKGGLADASGETVMLHTSTHLMLAALRKFLGEHVHQAGSNITSERTRFDFTHPEKVSREILDQVEAYVNEAISKQCPMVIEQMKKDDAQAQGVEGSFWEKYPDVVDVYMVKCDDGTVYSRELCGGPHVKNTADIKGRFKIVKEEASSAGVRRIKAVIEQ
ncbi:MAG: alanine--tRNA ligase [Candidatus Yonathbacteria bacterium RIFOXYC1_FULL_52_10]|uniref:Alanine--tRNA ligase n=1 Tax=Candidatus Yonathbacteria bacterium RIFOXYD1_FULL_52_36 TaxID=1802730 RepID=A0A1G2SJ94_9BACT|nr:MAG: alanine--tRNA ligase [Candidatus Yonathbacteria bacterium RIFOXYC1_FULL_52_10]OHA85086.1 MAG: alanine--tRNA ligase [Candidatus Yonathbacteria bacterium RIFOXYD1_FULL_52_36]